jgi:hypothetical protein
MFPIGSHLSFEVTYAKALSPRELGVGDDERKIAVRWQKMNLQYTPFD